MPGAALFREREVSHKGHKGHKGKNKPQNVDIPACRDRTAKDGYDFDLRRSLFVPGAPGLFFVSFVTFVAHAPRFPEEPLFLPTRLDNTGDDAYNVIR
jgi:hypothetical protein